MRPCQDSPPDQSQCTVTCHKREWKPPQVWPDIAANHIRDAKKKSEAKAADSPKWDTPDDAPEGELTRVSEFLKGKIIEAGLICPY